MAEYVKSEANSMLELPSTAILEGRFAFNSIDHLWLGKVGSAKAVKGGKHVHVGGAVSGEAGLQEEPHAGGEVALWRSNLASNGTVYYYNSKTRETTWEKPAAFVDPIKK